MRVAVDAAARQEWLDAVAHYAEALGTRGALRFVRAVLQTVERIADAPGSSPAMGPTKRVRKARVLRYPHSVFYVIASADEVRVVAVAHGRRRPGYWTSRLVSPAEK